MTEHPKTLHICFRFTKEDLRTLPFCKDLTEEQLEDVWFEMLMKSSVDVNKDYFLTTYATSKTATNIFNEEAEGTVEKVLDREE